MSSLRPRPLLHFFFFFLRKKIEKIGSEGTIVNSTFHSHWSLSGPWLQQRGKGLEHPRPPHRSATPRRSWPLRAPPLPHLRAPPPRPHFLAVGLFNRRAAPPRHRGANSPHATPRKDDPSKVCLLELLAAAFALLPREGVEKNPGMDGDEFDVDAAVMDALAGHPDHTDRGDSNDGTHASVSNADTDESTQQAPMQVVGFPVGHTPMRTIVGWSRVVPPLRDRARIYNAKWVSAGLGGLDDDIVEEAPLDVLFDQLLPLLDDDDLQDEAEDYAQEVGEIVDTTGELYDEEYALVVAEDLAVYTTVNVIRRASVYLKVVHSIVRELKRRLTAKDLTSRRRTAIRKIKTNVFGHLATAEKHLCKALEDLEVLWGLGFTRSTMDKYCSSVKYPPPPRTVCICFELKQRHHLCTESTPEQQPEELQRPLHGDGPAPNRAEDDRVELLEKDAANEEGITFNTPSPQADASRHAHTANDAAHHLKPANENPRAIGRTISSTVDNATSTPPAPTVPESKPTTDSKKPGRNARRKAGRGDKTRPTDVSTSPGADPPEHEEGRPESPHVARGLGSNKPEPAPGALAE